MRFLLYNLRYGTGNGGRWHLPWSGYLRRTDQHIEHIITFIRRHKPDIIGLVEVDVGSYRARRCNQAELIAKALGHYHVYQSKYGRTSLAQRMPVLKKQANAFLTTAVVHAQRFHYFNRGIKRLVIELELGGLVLFLVHLSLRFRVRQDQLNDLYTLLQGVKKPCILAGDFNVFRGEREMRLFLAATGLKSVFPYGQPTFPSWSPRRQLDFILYSAGIKIENFSAPRVEYSDHLPLVCDFSVT